uniref:Chitin-binding type-4 domain-containing protein n=1 Tax=Globisporangium ultimum (strain ATCC 200006 / CBS 805.95 / DAOM BR144) TaxID=431595 RepID=K3WLP1_GLOUD
MKTCAALTLASAAALLAPASIEAHGYVSQPKGTYNGGSSYTSYSAEITASSNKGFNGYIFNRSPEQNTQQFTAAWPKTGYKSLKQMMDKAVPGCGYSNPNAAPVDVSKMSAMKFQNNEYKEGFLGSHHGPCEGWIDNTRVFHYDDCVAKFPGYPATIPMSYKSCKGTCRLTFYWLALHSPKWQAYKSCVAIKNNAYSEERSSDPEDLEDFPQVTDDETDGEVASTEETGADADAEESTADEVDGEADVDESVMDADEESSLKETGDEDDFPSTYDNSTAADSTD